MGSSSSKEKGKPDRPGKPGKSGQPLSDPSLAPGFYGNFPATLSIYYGQKNGRKSDSFYLATDAGGQATPLYLWMSFNTMSKHQLTLFAGPTQGAAPLGLAGTEKTLSTASLIALPPPGTGPGAGNTGNWVERMADHGSIKTGAELNRFTIAVGALGTPAQHSETFEWRGNVGDQPPRQRMLVRVNSSVTGGEEVVGVWNDEPPPRAGGKLGTFRLQGSGVTGELGPHWTLMAVMTMLRICQIRFAADRVLDDMVKIGGKVVGLGAGMGG